MCPCGYYCTEDLKQLAAKLVQADVAKEAALQGAMHCPFEKFTLWII